MSSIKYEIINLIDRQDLKEEAANWFSSKWSVPKEAYLESMEECFKGENSVPQWYVAIEEGRIIGGLGVIENDFHERKDLAPNVCAVFVEEDKRCNGIAGELLNYVCEDMKKRGVDTLYLLTDHDSFYERYGWEYFCEAYGDGEEKPSRMYIHRFEKNKYKSK